MPGLGTKEGTAFRQDLLINRPVAEPSLEGFFFFATDDKLGTLYQCDGEEWVPITGGLRGLVAGPGITLVNTPTTITINNTYSLPIATSSILGGIKVGSGLAIDSGGIMTLDLPPDIAYTDHINTFIKEQFITVPDDFQAAGLSISATGLLTVGLDVFSQDVAAITAASRSPIATSGIPAVDVFANGLCMRLFQGLDALDAPNTKPVLLVQRGGATSGSNVYSGALIAGVDFPVGSQVSTGPLLQLQKLSADKFVIDNSGNIKVVSGVSPSNGQLLIGNGSGMSVAALTAGSNITITNGAGIITIASTAGGTTETIKHSGTTIGTRPTINFIDGTNVTLTVTDNGGTNAVDVTITSTGGGGGGVVPSVKATNTVATTVTSGVGSGRSIPFNTTLYDQGTGTAQHSTSSNTDRLTCRTNGIYLITATIWWTNNSTGIRELEIDKIRFSDSFDVTLAVESVGASTPCAQEISVQAELVVGDYVLALVTQTSGGNLDIIADASGEYAQSFSMTKIA